MTIEVASRRKSEANLLKAHPGASLIDVTSKGADPWVRFSPFYPHGGIPIPLSPGQLGQSVEGIWQGLKVFESEDIDPKRFEITAMKGLKRTVRKYGKVKGHRAGVHGQEILDYKTARQKIYLPAYRFVLEHRLQDEVKALKVLAQKGPLVLLDYETNCDIEDLRTPLSHAGLVKAYLEAS